MKALIAGTRICQIEEDEDVFPVSPSLRWVDCNDSSIIADQFHSYVDGKFVVQTTSNEEHLATLRRERNARLQSSDWTQASDSPLSSDKKTEWATYRQTLRNIPANTADPAAFWSNPTWPDEPS